MTFLVAAVEHALRRVARAADSFLEAFHPLTYERGDYSDGTEQIDPDYEPASCFRRTRTPEYELRLEAERVVVAASEMAAAVHEYFDGPDSEAVAPPAASATPAGVCAPSEAPPAGPPIMSLDWIEPAVLDVLCKHTPSADTDKYGLLIRCGGGDCFELLRSWADWREHCWDDLRDRLERASKPK